MVCWCLLELEKRACSFKCAIVYILQSINSLEHSVSVPGCTSLTVISLFKIQHTFLWALQYIELYCIAFNLLDQARGSLEQINMPVNYVCRVNNLVCTDSENLWGPILIPRLSIFASVFFSVSAKSGGPINALSLIVCWAIWLEKKVGLKTEYFSHCYFTTLNL